MRWGSHSSSRWGQWDGVWVTAARSSDHQRFRVLNPPIVLRRIPSPRHLPCFRQGLGYYRSGPLRAVGPHAGPVGGVQLSRPCGPRESFPIWPHGTTFIPAPTSVMVSQSVKAPVSARGPSFSDRSRSATECGSVRMLYWEPRPRSPRSSRTLRGTDTSSIWESQSATMS